MFFSNETGVVFEAFSFLHILLFVFTILGILFIYFNREKIRNHEKERNIAKGMAIFALIWELGLKAWQIYHGDNPLGILPIGLCAFTLYFGMYALFFKSRTAFSIAYLWSWGAILSVLFPDISYSYDRYRFYQFMIGHMFFFFMYMYMLFVYKWYPNKKDWIRSIIVLLSITIILIILSNIMDYNFMYMLDSDGTPFSMFEGHGYYLYLLQVIISAIILITIWYIPFFVYWKKKKKIS